MCIATVDWLQMALMPPDWCGWGRLSDDGQGHYNPDPSEGRPLGRRSHVLPGGAQSKSAARHSAGNRCDHEVHEGCGLFLITVIYHCISKLPFRVLIDADIWKYTSIVIIIGFLEIIDAFGNVVDGETSVLTNGLVLQFIVAPVLRFCRRDVELLQNSVVNSFTTTRSNADAGTTSVTHATDIMDARSMRLPP